MPACRSAAAALLRRTAGAPAAHVRHGIPAPLARTTTQPLAGLVAASACGGRRFKADVVTAGSPADLSVQGILTSHASISECAIIGNVAYVVKETAPTNTSSKLLGGGIEDWELREFLRMRMAKQGMPAESAPEVRFIDVLPKAGVPFSLVHVLDALFQEMDMDKCGAISFLEFTEFCKERDLFEDNTADLRELFFDALQRPSTSEYLFRGNGDMFESNVFEQDKNQMKFYDFQKLLMDNGIVEALDCTGRGVYQGGLVSYFVDERVVDIVLKAWLKMYDISGDGKLQYSEYARLIKDYRIPFAASEEAFALKLKAEGGIGMRAFRNLLEKTKVLQTGMSVHKDDEAGLAWREIKDTQVFLRPKRVFVADGREGVAEARPEGVLRFVCISDTHGMHREMTSRLPAGDVLLHAGDFSMCGGTDEVADFGSWFGSLPFQRKIVIAGNHDLSFDRSYEGHHHHGVKPPSATDAAAVRRAFWAACGGVDRGVVYLEDSEVTVGGVRIYGTPWQPEFGYWAFNLARGEAIRRRWNDIPEGIDVLLVHGPALGRGDHSHHRRVGCVDLLSEVQNRIRPEFVVSGHVHEGAGVTFDGTTHFVNASTVDEHYTSMSAPLVFDMPVKA